MKRSHIHIYIINPGDTFITISVPSVILCTIMIEIFLKNNTARISKDDIA